MLAAQQEEIVGGARAAPAVGHDVSEFEVHRMRASRNLASILRTKPNRMLGGGMTVVVEVLVGVVVLDATVVGAEVDEREVLGADVPTGSISRLTILVREPPTNPMSRTPSTTSTTTVATRNGTAPEVTTRSWTTTPSACTE